MEDTSRNPGKDGDGEEKEENAVLYAIESLRSKCETIVSKRCRRNREPAGRTLILSIRRELLLHNSYNSIPKHLTTCDEKYVLRCLELIRSCALRAAAWNFSQKVDMLSDHTSSKNRNSKNMAIEYPLGGQTEVVVGSSGDWTIGTISGSPTMINILKSPLLQQFGPLDGNSNFGKTDLDSVSKPFYSDFIGLVQEPASALPHKPRKDVIKVVDSKYVSHRRDASISSSNSSFSDQSSSSSSHGASFQGMLQCTWKNGLPHHVFTVDDKKEVYVANLSEADSSSYDKDLDYVYTFHLRRNGKKDELELETVAKMNVSTSITFNSNNSEVRETRFVLSVSSDNQTQGSNQAQKKSKGLTRKVVDVFRQGHFHKRRSSSILEGSSGVFQDSGLEPSEDVSNAFLDVDDRCAENRYGPNHELAAIVVKHTSNVSKEVELGGWGLKFLKKTGSVGPVVPLEHSRDSGECSTSMDVVIPASLHGGPRTRVGGPSGLIERWMSGGLCDCGGWDIGCPLTILKTRSTNTDCSSFLESSGECKSIDLYMQGSKQNGPMMKMANIHKGLYYIHFQSAVSALQSFAIAAAVIHSHSPVLRSKVYRS